MKNKVIRSCVSAALAVLLFFSSIPVNTASAANKNIQISTAEDLIELAKNCHVDKWSKGKTVTLTADVDLSDSEFETIPVFAGTFDGKGHTIKGLQYENGKYVAGFFRFITKDATVKNLTLEAAVSSDSEQQCVGGICGENSGLIEDCTFYGTVDGRSETGGIAGSNTASGTIRSCVSKGVMTGLYDTGGIVGKNHGLVTRCTNRAGVNNSKEWVSQEDESGLDWLKTLRNEEESASIQSGVDTGGIAGYSDGVISFCENRAIIGYEHTGYNIGGIAGRQAGVLTLCENKGEVYGRKDVGGVVGQMEPYIEMNEADRIEEEIKKLHDLIERLLDDVDASGDTISADYRALKESADTALGTTHTLAGQVTDFVDDNIDAVNEIAARVEYIVDALPEIQKNVSGAIDYMSVVNEDLAKINEDLAVIDQMKDTPYTGTSYDRLTVVSSVGGKVSADNSSPAKGVTVTLTAKAEDGYKIDAVTVYDSSGTSIPVTSKSNGTYTFTMPENNAVVSASFSYAGKYMAGSNAGGKISLTETDTQLTIRVQTDDDYILEALTVGNKSVPQGQLSGSSITVNKADYPLPDKNVVVVQGTFKNTAAVSQQPPELQNGEYGVKTCASAGGSIYADRTKAKEGETVTVSVAPRSGYHLKQLMVNNEECQKDENDSYTFTMPAEDVVVTASYMYDDAEKKEHDIYCESSAGGEVLAVAVPGSGKNRYTITITPDSDHRLPEQGDCLRVYADGDMTKEALLSVPRSQMNHVSGENYSYTLNLENQISGYQTKKPLLVYVSFESGEPRHKITSLSATGGLVTADTAGAGKNTSVRVIPVAAKEYQLDKVSVIGKQSGRVIYETSQRQDTYEFLMPDEEVALAAVFRPAPFAVVSNVGGSADYTMDGNKVTFTVHPSAGYSLSGEPAVRDTAGKTYAVAKQKSNAYEYMVDISGASGLVTANVTFGAQNQYDALKSAIEAMESSSAQMQDAMNTCGRLVDEMSGILLDSSGNPKDWDSISKNDKDTLAKDIVELARQLAAAGSAAARMAGSISVVADITNEYVVNTVEALNKDIKILNGHMQDMINCLDAASSAVTSVTDYLAMQSSIQFTQLGDEFDKNIDTLYENLLDISDRMERLEQDMNAAAKTVTRDFRAINNQLNTVLLLFVDRIDQMQNPDTSDYYKDVSDEDIQGTKTGKVKSCKNFGVVEGDINVGGVAGSMAVDEEDPEDSAAGTARLSVGAVYQTKCILQSSKNYGYVKAKKDGAGGVAGYMKLGVVTSCEGYGEVRSTEGDYAGGICGDSSGIIRKSFALCMVEGGSYVGGITGYGEGIYNCYAMADTYGGGSRIGAIAGQVGERNADGSRNQADYAKDNYYVGDDVYGIDGISYVGVAEPVSYKKLLTTEGLPKDYSHLQVSYVIDGECVEKEEVEYGAKLDTLKMPEIPDKDGRNGIWPDVSGEVMTSNRVLEAEYVDDVTVLGSEETAEAAAPEPEEGTEESESVEPKAAKRPCAFVEGRFTGKARLNAQLLPEGSLKELPVSGSAQMYEVKLTGTGLGDSDESSLRLLNSYGDNAAVYQYADGRWKLLKSKSRGAYQQVKMSGTECVFAVVDARASRIYIYIIAGAAALAVVLAFAVRKHANKAKGRRKKRR